MLWNCPLTQLGKKLFTSSELPQKHTFKVTSAKPENSTRNDRNMKFCIYLPCPGCGSMPGPGGGGILGGGPGGIGAIMCGGPGGGPKVTTPVSCRSVYITSMYFYEQIYG